MPLAGGMTLLPTIKQRLAAPAALIDLSRIPQMFGISADGGVLTIGAMTRHVDVAESEIVRGKIPLLAGLAGGIGDPAVRNRGTIGGSVANNDPSADYPAAVLALGATIVTDRREIAADAFFHGLFETALEPNEVITALRFPIPLRRRLRKIQIAGLPLRDRRRLRRQNAAVGARRRDRRGLRCVPRAGNGSRAGQARLNRTRFRRSGSTPKD